MSSVATGKTGESRTKAPARLELILGVKAERRSLEDIARPLTAASHRRDQPQGQLRSAT
jgi:hypothetical protein